MKLKKYLTIFSWSNSFLIGILLVISSIIWNLIVVMTNYFILYYVEMSVKIILIMIMNYCLEKISNLIYSRNNKNHLKNVRIFSTSCVYDIIIISAIYMTITNEESVINNFINLIDWTAVYKMCMIWSITYMFIKVKKRFYFNFISWSIVKILIHRQKIFSWCTTFH